METGKLYLLLWLLTLVILTPSCSQLSDVSCNSDLDCQKGTTCEYYFCRIQTGQICNDSDVNQCVDHAQCQLDTSSQYTCQCDQNHFNIDGQCEASIMSVLKKKTTSELLEPWASTLTSVKVVMMTDEFTSVQDELILAGLVLCRQSDTEPCDPKPRCCEEDYTEPERMPTWKMFRDRGYIGYYRSTPDNWYLTLQVSERKKRFAGQGLLRQLREAITHYTIGDNITCENLPDDEYCNGPLQPGSEYHVNVFACTRVNCSETYEAVTVRTAKSSDGNTIPKIVGGAVAGAAILVAVIILFFNYLRSRGSI